MSRNQLDKFLRLLKASPSSAVFNPWWEVDRENDIRRIAPIIRRQQLRAYLQERLERVKLVVIGEALGYRGGHFTGIPMTSERMLLGRQAAILAALSQRRSRRAYSSDSGRRPPLQILSSIKSRRTSKPSVCPDGFSEPTATIVWGALLKFGVLPDEFVLWNAFPWHSFDPHRGLLSNRMPNKSEQLSGRPALKAFLELFACEQIVALGKIAAAQLEELGLNAHCVRHPASGGAKLFRQQIAKLVYEAR
ncbi:MAG TPA: uracil-DNA glycosylase [Candidatus Udaeobacter sp.]|nr:uracil-DNA glycosylase [Candidatus Udaeobacter sp.]